MGIAEDQLDIWAKLGPIPQFVDTYNAIRTTLLDSKSPYSHRDFDVHLQGSYGNNTNVRGDSDVDVVIFTRDTYHYDIDHLQSDQKQRYQQENKDVPSACPAFKQEVIAWLNENYGAANVVPGNKAIELKPNSYRRSADILVATEHRQFYSYTGNTTAGHHKGIRFFDAKGNSIVNFPKLHAESCTDKHKATSEQFKPTIRIFKNMRNRMIEKKLIQEGVAPSYYIEGALWNVPNDTFSYYYNATVPGCLDWLAKADRDKLLTANQRRWLVRDGKPDSWEPWKFDTWLNATIKFWNTGG
jgi:hypothetical protein